MWHLLDTLTRPPLSRHLCERALACNETARRQLAGDGPFTDLHALTDALDTGAACWQVLRAGLPSEQWIAIRSSLRRQRKLRRRLEDAIVPAVLPGLRRHVATAGEGRALERWGRHRSAGSLNPAERTALEALIVEQGAWLRDLSARHPVAEAALLDAMTLIYRKACKAVARDWRSTRARRQLGHLVRLEELIDAPSGPMSGGGQGPRVRRQLHMALTEYVRLGRLAARGLEASGSDKAAKDARQVARVIERRRRELVDVVRRGRPEVCAAGPATFRAGLPWRVFGGLIEQPLAHSQATDADG